MMMNKNLEYVPTNIAEKPQKEEDNIDDAVSVTISKEMRKHIQGFDDSSRDGQRAITLTQAVDDGLDKTQHILRNLRSISVQALNEKCDTQDRQAMQTEVEQLLSKIDEYALSTEFDGYKPLAGGKDGIFILDIAIGDDTILSIESTTTEKLGIADISVRSVPEARVAIKSLDNALEKVKNYRLHVADIQNKLQHNIKTETNSTLDDSEAASKAMDTTLAKILNLHNTKAHSGIMPQRVLQLIS